MIKNNFVPYVIERTDAGERSYDIYSRLLKDRIVMLEGEVNDHMINAAIAQLLFLNNEDNTKPIYIYINSPGGSCTAGLALIDVMNYVKAPIYTVVTGMAASMGAAILSAGEKGHRYALPNSSILCHQSSGGEQGNIQDARVRMRYWEELNTRLAKIISTNCGMELEKYLDATIRDCWMFPEEGLKFGIIDEILEKEI